MADKFQEIVFTDSVRKAQAHYYGKSQRVEDGRNATRLRKTRYTTPRYTAAEVEAAVAPLKQRIAELEAELKKVR